MEKVAHQSISCCCFWCSTLFFVEKRIPFRGGGVEKCVQYFVKRVKTSDRLFSYSWGVLGIEGQRGANSPTSDSGQIVWVWGGIFVEFHNSCGTINRLKLINMHEFRIITFYLVSIWIYMTPTLPLSMNFHSWRLEEKDLYDFWGKKYQTLNLFASFRTLHNRQHP